MLLVKKSASMALLTPEAGLVFALIISLRRLTDDLDTIKTDISFDTSTYFWQFWRGIRSAREKESKVANLRNRFFQILARFGGFISSSASSEENRARVQATPKSSVKNAETTGEA
jgi:hypothetical protein